MSQEPNQFGNPGLSFPNALGVAFSQSQVGGQGQNSNIDLISTVQLTLVDNDIFATPGTSFVDIGESATGQNVKYISQMAGTTFINSPTMVNGNLVLPHQYNFSMNPEGNPSLPTATVNANVLVGGAATIGVGTSGTPITSITTYANATTVNSSNAAVNASTINLTGSSSYLDIDNGRPFIDVVSQAGGIAFTSGSLINSLATTMSNYSSNYISNTTSNYGITARDISFYSSNQYSNYNGGTVILADGGIDPARIPSVDITSQNGTYGHIGLKAYGGLYDLGYGGDVKIEAFGAGNPAVGIGGLVQINAYSADAGEYGAAVSRVSLNAACITLAAGAFAPIPGSPGAANVFGQGLVSIVAATLLPILPQIPQSVYLFGNSGVRLESGSVLGVNQGISMLSDMYAGTIYPIANGSNPLIIRGRSSPSAGVQLMDVEKINMVSPNGYITGVSSINSLSFNDPYNIGGVSTINGAAYPPPQGDAHLWSYYPQLSSLSSITAANGLLSSLNVSSITSPTGVVSFVGTLSTPTVQTSTLTATSISTDSIIDLVPAGPPTLQIQRISTLNGTPYIPTQGWSQTAAVQDVNVSGYNLNNVNNIYASQLEATAGLVVLNPSANIQFGGTDLKGVSSINGKLYPPPATAPTGTFSSILVSSIGSIYGGVVNMKGVIINQLDGLFSSNVNTPIITNVGGGPLQIYNDAGVVVGTSVSPLSLINLSSINGVPYSAGSAWNGNATTNLNMNFNDITTVQNMNTNSLYCVNTLTTAAVNASGTITANQFNAPNIQIYNNAITVGGIGATYVNNGGINTPQINLTQFVNTPALSNVNTINGVKTYCSPNVNQYISVGVTGITYIAVSPGTVNIQSANATGGGDLSVIFQIRDSDNIPGEYRFVNANAKNNMNVQFQTVDPYGNVPNWGGNTQLNPGQSILCRCWYSNYQGRYVINDFQVDGNP